MAMNDRKSIPLYLFAKEPVAGKVKTRMQPNISAKQSAELARRMLAQSIAKISKGWPGKRILSVSPDCRASLFKDLANQYHFELENQVSGDLGERLKHCLVKGIRDHGSAAVMGCDTPHVSTETLAAFNHSMQSGNNVVGPAEDGGFYFLGLDVFDDELFSGVQWGGSRVLSKIQYNASNQGIEIRPLSPLRDIDNWEDLLWLASTDDLYADLCQSAEP